MNKLLNKINSACIGKEICKFSNFNSFLKQDVVLKSEIAYKYCTDDAAIMYI